MRNNAIAAALGKPNAQAPLPRHASDLMAPPAARAVPMQPHPQYPHPMPYGHPQGPQGMMPAMPGNVEANLPPGVYNDSYSQAMAPFMGAHQLPGGQTISVTMNAPNPHLSFKEWAARGVVGGIGRFAAWPFKLVGGVIETAAQGIVTILLKLLMWIAILILAPTLIYAGMLMMKDMQSATTVEEGVTRVMHHGRHAVEGARKGAADDLPPEKGAAGGKTAGRAD